MQSGNDKAPLYLLERGYNVLLQPGSGLKPLDLVGVKGDQVFYLGSLESFGTPTSEPVPRERIRLQDRVFNRQNLNSLKGDPGLTILNWWIKGLGCDPTVKFSLAHERTISFRHAEYQVAGADASRTSRWLRQAKLDAQPWLVEDFVLGDGAVYVVTKTLRPWSLTVEFSLRNGGLVSAPQSELRAALGKNIRASTSGPAHMISLQGSHPLVFGFQCYQMGVSEGMLCLMTAPNGGQSVAVEDDQAGEPARLYRTGVIPEEFRFDTETPKIETAFASKTSPHAELFSLPENPSVGISSKSCPCCGQSLSGPDDSPSGGGPGQPARGGEVTEGLADRQQYVMLPRRGLLEYDQRSPAFQVLTAFGEARSTAEPMSLSVPQHPNLGGMVIDSIRENGPKLVEMSREQMMEFHRREIGLRLEPIRYYRPAPPFNSQPPAQPPGAANMSRTTLQLVCAVTKAPVKAARVTAVLSTASNLGDTGTSDAEGRVNLALGPGPLVLERLYVDAPLNGFWGAYRAGLAVNDGQTIALQPVDFTFQDALRRFYKPPQNGDGNGVRVGVVDCGVGPHPHLNLVEGHNTVRGEPDSDFADNGLGHGTHVAGIIASTGNPRGKPPGFWGLAPAAQLVSLRVFGANNAPSTNYAIIKAIFFAMEGPGQPCDIINLSLSGDPGHDQPLDDALQDARDHGILVVAAAGNNYRQPVNPLARYASKHGLSVSAMGRKGTFPEGAFENCYLSSYPGGADSNNFMAAFTNYGEVSLTAPGVGIISTVPQGGYAPQSGTSMACPVVAGFAARLWSRNSDLFNQPRNSQRVVNLINLLNSTASTLGFPYDYVGSGIPA